MSIAPNGEAVLGEVYLARGDYDKAFNLFSDIPWENERLIRQAQALFAAGDVKGFEQLKAEYLAKFRNPLQIAMLYAIEGDSETALEFVQLAFSKSAEGFGFIMWDPVFAGLRGEPGWEELRERAGLSEAQIAGTRLNLPNGI